MFANRTFGRWVADYVLLAVALVVLEVALPRFGPMVQAWTVPDQLLPLAEFLPAWPWSDSPAGSNREALIADVAGDPITAQVGLLGVTSIAIALSKIHHAAFDSHLVGISPDGVIHVSDRLLEIHDGPFLELGIKQIQGTQLWRPRRAADHPDRDRLARRFEEFRAAASSTRRESPPLSDVSVKLKKNKLVRKISAFFLEPPNLLKRLVPERGIEPPTY